MALLALLQIAWRNLLAHRQRTLLLWATVGGATSLFVVLLAVAGGAAQARRLAVTALLSGDINVGGFYKVHPDTVSPAVADAPAIRKVFASALPPGCQIRERGRGHALLWAARRRVTSFVVGVDGGPGDRELYQLLGPREGSLDALTGPDALALSAALAEQLHVKVGDMTTLYATTTGGKFNAADARVVAITDNIGLFGEASGIVASNGLMRRLYGYKPDVVGALQARCGRQVDLDAAAEKVRDALRKAGHQVLPPTREAYADRMFPLLRESWRGQRLDVSTWEDESAFLSFVTDGIGGLTLILGAVVLAITIGGVFLSLSLAIRERTREIGTLRAVGMQRPAVVGVLVLEGLMTGLVAAAAGALVTAPLCRALDGTIHLPEVLATLLLHPTLSLAVPTFQLMEVVAVISFGAALGAVIPAARAASLPPRVAMESIQ